MKKILFQVKLHFGITEIVEQLTAAKHIYKEQFKNRDLHLKKMMLMSGVVIIVVELAVRCIL
jgi:hypothetical protein